MSILECCFSSTGKSSIKNAETSINAENQLPIFTWLNCSEQDSKFYVCMKVLFPTIGEHDVLLLNKFEHESTVLEGHLKNESDVQVSVVINDEPQRNNITVSCFCMIV